MFVDTATFKGIFACSLLTAAIFCSASAISTTEAGAISFRTKLACRTDYRSYCNSYMVGSKELRQCMNENGHRLSNKCVNALVADGEISAEEVARRAAAGNR